MGWLKNGAWQLESRVKQVDHYQHQMKIGGGGKWLLGGSRKDVERAWWPFPLCLVLYCSIYSIPI